MNARYYTIRHGFAHAEELQMHLLLLDELTIASALQYLMDLNSSIL